MPLPIARLYWSFQKKKNPYRDVFNNTQSIFIHIPKAAGTSLAHSIYKGRSWHIPLARYAAFDKKKFDTYYKFCFVRNPWDRIFSSYNYLYNVVGRMDIEDARWATRYLAGSDSFKVFIHRLRNKDYLSKVLMWKHFKPQYLWITLPGQKEPCVDFVGRFENIYSDFKIVTDHLDISSNLSRERASGFRANAYLDYYDDEMVSIVGDIYREDIGLFDYTFS